MSSISNEDDTSASSRKTPALQQRRFVLFLGPPKTASTSLQRFLSTYANIKSKDFIPAFQGWNYPLFLGTHTGLHHLENPAKIATIRKTFDNQAVKYHVNVVAGSEFLASHHRFLGGRLFETLQNWTGGIPPEIVIMMRSPRVDHWISCWKQGSQIKGKDTYGVSFEELLCNPDYETRLKRIITRTTNPLQIAYETIVDHNLTTTVVDMRGVSNAGFDVSHVFSCEILNVPCVADDAPWVVGLGNTTIHVNSRHGNADLSADKEQALERIFQQRDCAFYNDLAHHPQFRLLHRHDGFWAKNCEELHPKASSFRSDGTALIQELRNTYQCPELIVDVDVDVLVSTKTNGTAPALYEETVDKERYTTNTNTSSIVATQGKERLYELPTGIMIESSNLTVVLWLAVVCLFFLVGLMFRRTRRHGVGSSRRHEDDAFSAAGVVVVSHNDN